MGKKLIKIFEKDLFKFIFFPKDLAVNKYRYIRQNFKKYLNELDLLINILEITQTKISTSTFKIVKEKIASREKEEVE